MYRQSWLSVTVSGFAMNSRSHYSVNSVEDMNTWDFGSSLDFLATTNSDWA